MRTKLLPITLFALAVTTALPAPAAAQPDPTEPVSSSAGTGRAAAEVSSVLFHWAEPEPDWTLGALYALLGFAGALVTMFSLIGGAIPGTAGTARVDAESERLKAFYARLTQLAEAPVLDAAAVNALNGTVDKLRDDLARERWRIFALGFVLYVVLGAFFAMAIARDHLQALVIGAGWTSFIGSLGLKSDFAERKRIKDQALDDAEDVVAASVGTDGHAPDRPVAAGGLDVDLIALGHVQEKIQIARAL